MSGTSTGDATATATSDAADPTLATDTFAFTDAPSAGDPVFDILGINSNGTDVVPGEEYLLYFTLRDLVEDPLNDVVFSIEFPIDLGLTTFFAQQGCVQRPQETFGTRILTCQYDSDFATTFIPSFADRVAFNLSVDEDYVPGTVDFGIAELPSGTLLSTLDFEREIREQNSVRVGILDTPNSSEEEFSVTVEPVTDLNSFYFQDAQPFQDFTIGTPVLIEVTIQAGPEDVEAILFADEIGGTLGTRAVGTRAINNCQGVGQIPVDFLTCGISLRAGESQTVILEIGGSARLADLESGEVPLSRDYVFGLETAEESLFSEVLTVNRTIQTPENSPVGLFELGDNVLARNIWGGPRPSTIAGIVEDLVLPVQFQGTEAEYDAFTRASTFSLDPVGPGASMRFLLPEGMIAGTRFSEGAPESCNALGEREYSCPVPEGRDNIDPSFSVIVTEDYIGGDVQYGIGVGDEVPGLTGVIELSYGGSFFDGEKLRFIGSLINIDEDRNPFLTR